MSLIHVIQKIEASLFVVKELMAQKSIAKSKELEEIVFHLWSVSFELMDYVVKTKRSGKRKKMYLSRIASSLYEMLMTDGLIYWIRNEADAKFRQDIQENNQYWIWMTRFDWKKAELKIYKSLHIKLCDFHLMAFGPLPDEVRQYLDKYKEKWLPIEKQYRHQQMKQLRQTLQNVFSPCY